MFMGMEGDLGSSIIPRIASLAKLVNV